jgi:hypothetical protein
VALNDLRDVMERIKTTPFTSLQQDFPNGAPNGVLGGGAERYGVVIGSYTLPEERITVTHHPSAAADPREMIVRITWTNRGRTYERTLSTMRASKAS